MRIIIDRIEGDVAVVELPNGQTLDCPAVLFPDGAEGDVFVIEKDAAEAQARQGRIEEKMGRLFVD